MVSSTIVCLVCSVPIGETNLGIEVCRACAAFFKRTTLSGRSFVCRQGNRECVFRKHEKFMCRSCRFDRCLEIGMNCGEEETVLDRVKSAYKLSVKHRLKEELKLATSLRLRKFEDEEGIYMSNIDFFYLNFPLIFKELKNILRSVIPRFDAIAEPLKESLCRNLIGKFNALEYYYLSHGRFRKRDGICMCSLISVFDIESLWEWVEVKGVTRKNDLMETMRTFANDYMSIFDQMLRTEEITEREFHAMIAILVCQLDTTIALPDDIQHIFDETRAKVFTELQAYYRQDLRLSDFSPRLGHFMSLSVAFSELHRNSEEQLRLYSTLFDVRSQDQLMKMALKE